MAKKKDRYVIGLDIGTHKVCAIVAEVTEEARRGRHGTHRGGERLGDVGLAGGGQTAAAARREGE